MNTKRIHLSQALRVNSNALSMQHDLFVMLDVHAALTGGDMVVTDSARSALLDTFKDSPNAIAFRTNGIKRAGPPCEYTTIVYLLEAVHGDCLRDCASLVLTWAVATRSTPTA